MILGGVAAITGQFSPLQVPASGYTAGLSGGSVAVESLTGRDLYLIDLASGSVCLDLFHMTWFKALCRLQVFYACFVLKS